MFICGNLLFLAQCELNRNLAEKVLMYFLHLHHHQRHCVPIDDQYLPKSAILNKISNFFSRWKSVKKKKKKNPNYEKKTSNALRADRAIHRVTLHPNRASPSEVLRVPVPKLGDGVVLVPGSLSLIFDLAVSGHANDYIVKNVARALVDRLTVKFAGEIAQDTDGYDLFKLCEDLFLTENERTSMFREGIQSDDLSKIRCNAEDEKKSGADKENKFIDVS